MVGPVSVSRDVRHQDAMKIFLRVLKTAACFFGGVVAASILFLVAALFVFGLHDPDRQMHFIKRWIPFVWFFGAACGGWIVYRSGKA
jgi:hypothetical protein